MKKLLLLVLFNLLLIGATAQTRAAFIRAGAEAMNKKDFYTAMSHYAEALEFPGSKTAIRYQYGEAARQFFAYDLAVQQYQLVLNDEKANRFPLTRFWLSIVYQRTGKYQKAINGFEEFIKNTPNQIFKERAINARQDCEWAKSLIRQPHDLEITHLDKKINTPYSEFGAVRRGDTLYYSSYRYQMTGDQTLPKKRITKVLTQKGTAKGRPLTRNFNEKNKLTAHTSLTPDGQRIYYTICEYTDEVNIRCQIYYREMDRRKRWGIAQKLPDYINLEGFTTTQPAWGINPATGVNVLYFSSDRPGGEGGMDIYRTDIAAKEFGKPVNLRNLNTEKEEITPFYHQQSQSLFFSSTGYQNLGGYDIYQAKHNGTSWQNPVHTGFPLNSSYNDIYFTLNADSTQAYISSNREGSYYLEEKNKACCNDLYLVKINPPLPVPEPTKTDTTILVINPPNSVAPVTPVLEDTTSIVNITPVFSVPVKATVIDTPTEKNIAPPKSDTPSRIISTAEELQSVLPLPLYFHNDQPDARSFLATTNTSYQTTYQDYIQRREEYIKAVAAGEKIEVEEFFTQDLEKGYLTFLNFCEGIMGQLEGGKTITLTLKGYTSPRAQSDYNLALGGRRTAAVINFFQQYNDGIFNYYLSRGQLSINKISLGETRAAPSVSDLLEDRRNSIYVSAAARERRVEIVGIKVQ